MTKAQIARLEMGNDYDEKDASEPEPLSAEVKEQNEKDLLALIDAIKLREDVYGVLINGKEASQMITGVHITSADKKAFMQRTRAYMKGAGSKQGGWKQQADARRHEEEKL